MIVTMLIVSLRKPGTAIGLLIIMFGLEQFLQTQDPIFMDRSYLVNVGIGVVVLVAATLWLFRHLHMFKLDSVHVASVALFALAFTSQQWTLSPVDFDRYMGDAVPYLVLFLILAPLLTLKPGAVRNGIWAALILGIPLIFLLTFAVEWDGRGVRMAAPRVINGKLIYYSPPLTLSSAAANIGFLALILVPKNKLLRILQFAAFALGCYITFRTQSRGQLVALALVTIIAYPMANQATRLKGLFITLAGFTVAAGALFFVFSMLDLGGGNRWTEDTIRSGLDGRFIMVERLLTAWWNSRSPVTLLFGLGACSGFHTSGFYVHNLPSEILGELGIVGAALFVFIYVQVFLKSIKILKKLEHYPEMRREIVALLALFMFASIISLKQGTLSGWPHLFFFAIAISHVELQSRHMKAQNKGWKQLFLISKQPGAPGFASAQFARQP